MVVILFLATFSLFVAALNVPPHYALSQETVLEEERLLLKLENPVAAFDEWMKDFNRTYLKGGPEWHKRYEIWTANLYHAVNYNKQKRTHWLTMTVLADMEQTEVKKKLFGLVKHPVNRKESTTETEVLSLETDTLSDVPRSIDWRKLNAVTSVKNQKMCRGCWAFSAVGGLEGLRAINEGHLEELSEQELIDCDTYDQGCKGGFLDSAFRWIVEHGGLTTSKRYEFKGRKQRCRHTKVERPSFAITGFKKVAIGEAPLIRALAKQPVSVGINSDLLEFSLYGGGIFDGDCGTEIDHAALAVGYDLDAGYILLKNSWSTFWGEDGYIRLALNKNGGRGQCGVAILAYYPVADAQPPQVVKPTPIRCGMHTHCEAPRKCCCTKYLWKTRREWRCCPSSSTCCVSSQRCPRTDPICDTKLTNCHNAIEYLPETPRTSTALPKRERLRPYKILPPTRYPQ